MLAEADVGVNAPQSALPQVAFQVTPWFLESLATVAATPHCSLTVMAVGGVKPGVNMTVMAGGMEFWLPQETSSVTIAAAVSKRSVRQPLRLARRPRRPVPPGKPPAR